MARLLPYGLIFGAALALFPLRYGYADAPQEATAASDVAFKQKDATVVELFTSQGCSSCPPAEAYMRELAGNPDVLTLEYHIDYWDSPSPRGWQDRFSKREWSERQLAYNQTLLKTERVYTPQMVVDGRYQGVGSNQSSIAQLIKEAHALRGGAITISPHVLDNKKLLVTVSGGGAETDLSLLLVRFLKRGETKVLAGENAGEVLANYNIVTYANTIGLWGGGRQTYKIAMTPLSTGEGCAVLLQDPETMRIFAGRLCGL